MRDCILGQKNSWRRAESKPLLFYSKWWQWINCHSFAFLRNYSIQLPLLSTPGFLGTSSASMTWRRQSQFLVSLPNLPGWSRGKRVEVKAFNANPMSYFFWRGIGDWTQGLVYEEHVIYHWATSSAFHTPALNPSPHFQMTQSHFLVYTGDSPVLKFSQISLWALDPCVQFSVDSTIDCPYTCPQI
jgi:hypothetical protein